MYVFEYTWPGILDIFTSILLSYLTWDRKYICFPFRKYAIVRHYDTFIWIKDTDNTVDTKDTEDIEDTEDTDYTEDTEYTEDTHDKEDVEDIEDTEDTLHRIQRIQMLKKI